MFGLSQLKLVGLGVGILLVGGLVATVKFQFDRISEYKAEKILLEEEIKNVEEQVDNLVSQRASDQAVIDNQNLVNSSLRQELNDEKVRIQRFYSQRDRARQKPKVAARAARIASIGVRRQLSCYSGNIRNCPNTPTETSSDSDD